MSICASVFCQDCRQFAPRIGDGGAIGYPSLKDTSRPATGDYQTFGYLKKGFDAIGYKPWDLEAIAAYLRAHKGHDVSLYLDNSDVKLDEWDEEQGQALADVSDATYFAFGDEGFVKGLFEAACDKCGVSVRSGRDILRSQLLRPFEPFVLKPADIRAFMKRVRDSDGCNFHRVFHFLDYYNEQEDLAKFLTEHAKHKPAVRIVTAV